MLENMWKTFSHKKWEKVGKSGLECLFLDYYLTKIQACTNFWGNSLAKLMRKDG